VITTNKRPVPLEHYLWVSNERYKIVDNRSNFLMGGYQSAMQAAKQKQVRQRLNLEAVVAIAG
jgi:antiviral helicase SKI2